MDIYMYVIPIVTWIASCMQFWPVLKNYILWWMVGLCIDSHVYVYSIMSFVAFSLLDAGSSVAYSDWETEEEGWR